MGLRPYTMEELAAITVTPATLGKHLGRDLLGYPWQPYSWVKLMERQVLAMLNRPGNEILCISVPPQNGKSTYCSMLLPAWYIGRNPGHQVINVSYNEEQAAKWGLRTLNLLRRYGGPLFGVSVHPDARSAADWRMDNGFGGMLSAGIRGGLSGNPGHLIILDDTLKNADEANSPTIKRKNLEEWDDSVQSRFQENTKVLIVATRWAEDDLTGEIIARAKAPGYAGHPVNVLNLKAIAEPDPDEAKDLTPEEREAWRDVLGRRIGEGLAGQHSLRFFEQIRDSKPAGRWYAMYQGTPTYSAGGMFPEFSWSYWVHDDAVDFVEGDVRLPEMVKVVRVWDLASSPDGGDWTVGTKVGMDIRNRIFVLDRERFRHAPGGVEERVVAIAGSDGHGVTIRIEKERSGAGETVVDYYKRKLPGYDVDEVRAEGDKESRATPASIEQSKGNVYLPRGAWWLDEWRKEFQQMDGKGKRPKHDDQIDTLAYAVRYLIQSGVSQLWDVTQLADVEGLTDDEKMHILAVRAALGV